VAAVDDEGPGVRIPVAPVVACGFGAEALGVRVVREAAQGLVGHGFLRLRMA
jgi:hypothetical protein